MCVCVGAGRGGGVTWALTLYIGMANISYIRNDDLMASNQ